MYISKSKFNFIKFNLVSYYFSFNLVLDFSKMLYMEVVNKFSLLLTVINGIHFITHKRKGD